MADTKPKMFPLQTDRRATPGPVSIPWSVAEIAYGEYASRYGRGQSLERLAERGGFSWGEMDTFHPKWREEVSELVALRAAWGAERERAVKLQLFKGYVHARLDAAGVPTDPDSPHKTEGCRVGGRLDEALAFFALARDQSEWSQATFGTDQERGPIGALKHLAKEAVEAQQAVVMNSDIGGDRGIIAEELADCLLLILDATRRAGFTPFELLKAAEEKMAVNKRRVWPKTVGDVPTEHLKAS